MLNESRFEESKKIVIKDILEWSILSLTELETLTYQELTSLQAVDTNWCRETGGK